MTLPDNISSLKNIIIELIDNLKSKDRLIGQLEHRLDLLLRSRYGSKSEKINPEELLPQLRELFEQPQAPQEEEPVKTQKISYERKVKGHGRNELPANLPREQKIYDLDESQKICPCCGDQLHKIGEEKSEQLNYTPASLYVLEHVRYKYGCVNKDCQQTIVTADKDKYEPIEKGLAGAGLLSQVIVSKYGDHCPLYRMEDIFSRHGVKISRSTMCDWMAQSAQLLKPLYELMKKRVLESKVVHTDDTPVKVQDNGLNKCRQGRIWIYMGDEDNPYNVFDYTSSRSREGPDEFLNGFMGYLQADAFGGYDGIYLTKPVTEVLCNAHARRKFYDARNIDPVISHTALAYYKRLYAVEKEIKEALELAGFVQNELNHVFGILTTSPEFTILDNEEIDRLDIALESKKLSYMPEKMLAELRKLRLMQEILLNCLIWEPKGQLSKDMVSKDIWDLIE